MPRHHTPWMWGISLLVIGGVAACSPAPPAQGPAESAPTQASAPAAPKAEPKAESPVTPEVAMKAAPSGSGPRSAAAEERNKAYAPWNPADMPKLRQEMGLVGPGPQTPLPKARFPGYLKKPQSLEDVMPQARDAVRQTGGRTPLGLAEPGDVVAIFVAYDADPLLQEAMTAAFKERNVEARIIYLNELVNVSKEDLSAIDEARKVFRAGDGQQELNFLNRTGAIPDWEAAQEWTKSKDPVLHDATWPQLNYPKPELADLAKNYGGMTRKAVIKYLDDHPEVTKVFHRTGGRTSTRKSLEHHGDKFVGNYTYLNHYDIMSQVPAFPSDVWRMIETKTIEPLAFIDRVEASDPEGTAFWFEVTAEEAKAWANGVYQQGHLYLAPAQASGRFPYSIIDYPSLEGEWIPPVQVRTNGVIASSNSHSSNHSRMEIHVKDGYISEIKGGGLYGDGFRLWLEYPKINELTWPFQKEPGFWWLYEAGTGTNPKYFKHPQEILEGTNSSERNAGGVIHWAFGAEVQVGPESNKVIAYSPKTLEFAKQNNLPAGHAMHNHNLLPTYQVRLRDGGRWVTLIEHGNMSMMRDPEVRALAARYGNPDEILRRDWIPEIPGITVSGDYNQDYAAKTGEFWMNWAKSINDGTNEYIE